jgi:Rad3-related DNA helicase
MEKQIYNILLTSGTLEPFAPWESELRLDFGITLSNEHVIDTKKNLCASILKCGPQQRIFNFNFDNRENEDMYCDLGNSIILLCQKVPHGVLIIFSSYALMTKCRNIWVSNTAYKIWERLNDLKPIIMEPKSANDLQETMF